MCLCVCVRSRVCVWGPKVEFPLCLWPDEEGKWCTCLPVFACTLPPVAKNQSLSVHGVIYVSLFGLWYENRPKQTDTVSSESELPHLTSVVFRSQALQPPELTALAVACCLLSSGEHRPASVCRRRMSQQGEILNPLKSADQRQWKGWRRALDGGRSRSCLLAF